MSQNAMYIIRIAQRLTEAEVSWFEGLTIRNTDVAFYAGLKGVAGCSGLVVRRCRMEQVGMGLLAQYTKSANFYIADNVILGRDDPLLMARAAENPMEDSKAEAAWRVVKETPSGEGDARTIICRAPQPLTESRIMGPRVCRRNGDRTRAVGGHAPQRRWNGCSLLDVGMGNRRRRNDAPSRRREPRVSSARRRRRPGTERGSLPAV